MTKRSGAQVLVESLAREGIEMVFGVPGNQNMPVFDALYHHPRVAHRVVRHEQTASFMADGYARASGRIAAVLSLPGPGVTFAYTGLAEAYTDSSPILLLASQINREDINQDKGILHELTGQQKILAPIMKFGERVTKVESIPGAVHRAVAALRSGRPRPAQLEIPRDVQLETVEWPDEPSVPPPAQQKRACAPLEAVESASSALLSAKRPMIYAGGGVISSGASDVLVRLAERLGAPVLTSGMGVGSIPGDHALACGVSWIAAADVRPLVAAADLLLAVGTRFGEAMTHAWTLDLPPVTIQIDVDADEIGHSLPMQYALVGDARATLVAIEERVAAQGLDRGSQIAPGLATARRAYRRALERRAGSSLPWARALRHSLPRDTIISADMTCFWADVLGMFPVYQPRTVLFPWGYGTLGFGVPAALGAKVAMPDRPVISIVGDGGFLYTGMELATAMKYKLGVPILVFNDNAFAIIKKQQRDQYGGRFIAVDLHNPDFVQLAHAFGAHGERVTTPEMLGEALGRALTVDIPTVIEIPWNWE